MRSRCCLSPPNLLELVALETVGERWLLIVHLDLKEPPAGGVLAARGTGFISSSLCVSVMPESCLSRLQPLELARGHCAFLGDAIRALGKHVQLAVLRQELDLHTGLGMLPGFEHTLDKRPSGVPTR